MFRRKLRSPLHGMSRHSIRGLRLAVRAHQHWERALGTPEQYLEVIETREMWDNLGYGTLYRLRERSAARWRDSEHYKESRQVYTDQHMKRYNRAAWEAKQYALEARKAREETVALRGEVEELRALITNSTPEGALRQVIADSGLTTIQVGRALGFNLRRALAGGAISEADTARIQDFRTLVDSIAAATPELCASMLLDSSRGQSLFSKFASAAPTMQRIHFGVPVEERLGIGAANEG